MLIVLKCSVLLVIVMSYEWFSASEVWAWGPGVHMMTALVSLQEVQYTVPLVANIINSYPVEYLYGCLAADFFIGKRRRRKKRNPHSWEGGFRFLEGVNDEHEAAYAYGFLSHLAADVVAHNFYIPNMVNLTTQTRRRSHLTWETIADDLTGPDYTRVAREVLRTVHQGCDKMLIHVSGRRLIGLKVKKRIFIQSVVLSHYLHTTKAMLFNRKGSSNRDPHGYVAYMVNLSCRTVLDFLRHPESSSCLNYDPVGRRNLRRTGRKNKPARFSHPNLSAEQISYDKEPSEP